MYEGESVTKIDELAEEQIYFSTAQEQFERSLSTTDHSAESAANPKAAAELRRLALARRRELDPDTSVAEGKFLTNDGDVLYIGKHLVRDETGEILVVNWQAPAARPYYAASFADPLGLTMKRTFEAERNRLVDFDDLVYADLLARVQQLEGGLAEPAYDDALLRDLERSRTGEMQDIVRTIQSAQYELIRTPMDRLLIIQGGPGTGKTAIALHRVSWLLFNHSDELQDRDVLVVGPNPTFSRYIRSLLPSLGDVDVVQGNLNGLGPTRSDRRDDHADIAGLKGEARMAGLLTRALANRVRDPEPSGSFEVSTRDGAVALSNDDLRQAINSARQQPTYARGRATIRTLVAELLARAAAGTLGASAQQVDAAVERLWPSLTPAAFLRDLLGSRDRIFEAAGHEFTAQEAGLLYRQSADRITEETWSDADVALLDEAEALINGDPSKFRHVVVDEAQDLSAMQMRSLRRRSNGSMTIVGDLAQSTGAHARTSWNDVADGLQQNFAVEQRDLEYGYRVPRQVMDLAARLLAVAAPDIRPPVVVRDAPEDPFFVVGDVDDHPDLAVAEACRFAGKGMSVGIICAAQTRHLVIEELNHQGVKWTDGAAGSLGQGINLVGAVDSKGLEFDAVVVVSPHVIVEEDQHGHRLLYIALTRTTRCLSVVHDGDPLALAATTDAVDAMLEPLEAQLGAQPALALPGLPQSPAQLEMPVVPAATESAFGAAAESVSTPGVSEAKTASPLHHAVVAAAAAAMSDEVRASVPPALWPVLIDSLRRSLNVSADDILDLLE